MIVLSLASEKHYADLCIPIRIIYVPNKTVDWSVGQSTPAEKTTAEAPTGSGFCFRCLATVPTPSRS